MPSSSRLCSEKWKFLSSELLKLFQLSFKDKCEQLDLHFLSFSLFIPPSFFNRKFSTIELSAVVICLPPQWLNRAQCELMKSYMHSCIMVQAQSKHEKFQNPSKPCRNDCIEMFLFIATHQRYCFVITIYNNWNGICGNLW